VELRPADLRKYEYFSSLSDNAIAALSAKLKVVNFPAGTLIVEEGAAAGSLFFVTRGSLEVTKKTAHGPDARLTVIGSGQGFGEMALLTCSPRSSSVRAVTEVTLYELSKADFEAIVLHESAFKEVLGKRVEDYGRYNRIKTLQPFALLDPDKMYALLSRMTEQRFAAGEDIIVQGDKGDNYYVIKSGRVGVSRQEKGEPQAKRLAVLGEGDGFGEDALIRDDPRNATCRAMEDTVVCVLDKTDFAQVLKSSFLEFVYSEDIDAGSYLDRYVLLDTRIPQEYEQEHIHGALSVPLERLRTDFDALDPAKEYITYCTNDARGMVAAFLLRNHGLKAKCLRGGLSGWSGPVVTGHDGVHLPEPR
jgi:CRP-like cAMP-binding protein